MSSSNPFDLKGRVTVITGGAGVLGFAMGVALAQSGATVILGSRDAARGEDAVARAKASGAELYAAAFDPGDAASIHRAFDNIEETHGPIQVLINAAGGNLPAATVMPGASFSVVAPDSLRSVMDTNVMAGAVLPTQDVLARVEKSPRETSIVMIGSVSSAAALTRVVGYGMAKSAVENLTRWLAVHVTRDLKLPVRVNAIVPGFFLTEQNRFLLTTEDGGLTSRGQDIIRQTPMSRFGDPEELGGAAIWLASDASSFVNGTTIDIDGGFQAWTGV